MDEDDNNVDTIGDVNYPYFKEDSACLGMGMCWKIPQWSLKIAKGSTLWNNQIQSVLKLKMLLVLLMRHSDDDHDVNSDFVDGDGDDGNVVGDGDFVHVSSAPRNPL